MIEVAGVGKRYGDFVALQDVSFTVGRGEVVGLLGPNGAGKTTLMRILTGYHYPNMGSANVAGADVVDAARAVKQRIGYLPENTPVYHDMQVYEYLRFIAFARGVEKGEVSERIATVVAQCALKDVLLKSIGTISKGYRQRVGLAQAMIHDPDILILDEPTSGLDPNQVIEIRTLIRQLGTEKTVILSTHVLQEVEAMCKRVLIINEGRLIAQGTTDEIAAHLKGEASHLCTFYINDDARSPAELRAALEAMKDVRSVVAFDKGGMIAGAQGYQAEVMLSAGGGAVLFQWAVDHGVTLTSLSSTKFKLEDIFVRLTT